MNEYEILGGLHKIIDDDTNLKMKEWLDSHNVNNYLLKLPTPKQGFAP